MGWPLAKEVHGRAPGEVVVDARFWQIVRSLPGNATQGYDAQGRCVFWDDASEHLYGYGSSEMVGQRLGGTILPVREGEAFEGLVRRTLASGLPSPAKKWDARNKKGEPVYVHSTLFPARLESGERVAVCADDDITGERRAALEEHRREEQFRALVENSPDVIARIDSTLRVLFVNSAIQRAAGQNPLQVVGLRLDEADLPPAFRSLWVDHLQRVFTSGNEVTFEYRQPTELGARHFEARISPELDVHGNVATVLAVARDVTQRHDLERQLLQAQKMESIGHLAGGIAHDFNNLLTVILGYTDVAIESLPSGSAANHELRNVKLAAEQAAGLTQQLLAFARQQVLAPQVVDLVPLIGSIETLLRRTLSESVNLTLDLAADGGRVRADPSQLQQVLLNLAINARDAMPRGGRLTVATRAVNCMPGDPFAREGAPPGSYLQLDVVDTGHGMSDEVRSRIFEPFFTTKEKGKGTGLGLATCYGIVRQSRGWIFCESAPGRGTRFTILLPVVEDAEEYEPLEEETAPPTGGNERVLLVEDDAAVRKLAESVLGAAGYRVTAVASAREALEFAERGLVEVDLLVTDVVMPGMGGIDLARALRRRRGDLKVLFTSGYPDATDLSMDRTRRPLDEHLQKPFLPKTLVRLVRELLDRPAPRPRRPA